MQTSEVQDGLAAAPDLAAGNIESGVAGVSDVNSAAPPAPPPPPPAPPTGGGAVVSQAVSNTSEQATAAVNVAPQLLAVNVNAGPENSVSGASAGSVAFTDPNAGQSVTYSIAGGNTGNAFAINPQTGQITVASSAALNFETNPNFNLTVQATDTGAPALFSQAAFTVNIANVNEAPVDVRLATQAISVVNASFETSSLSDGVWQAGSPGWTISGGAGLH